MDQAIHWRYGTIRDLLGISGLYLFASCAWLSTLGSTIGFILMLAALLVDPAAWAAVLRDRLFVAMLGFVAYVALLSLWAAGRWPEIAELQFEDWRNWTKLCAFLLTAWWLRADLGRIDRVLILALAGLALNMLRHMDWQAVARLDVAQRYGFGLNQISLGLISATALLGLLLFARRLRAAHWAGLAFGAVAAALVCYGLIVSGAKSAWLAIAVAMPPALFAFYRPWFGRLSRRRAMTTILAGLVIAAGVAALGSRALRSRLDEDRAVIGRMLDGQWRNLPRSSLSYRLDVQRFGLEKWLERPWCGWGPGSTNHLIRESGWPELLYSDPADTRWLAHTHNTYLETLVRLGIVGFMLLAAVCGLLVSGLRKARRSARLPPEYSAFLGGSLVLFAIWSLFDFRMLHTDVRTYWMLLAGIIYSFRLYPATDAAEPADPASRPNADSRSS